MDFFVTNDLINAAFEFGGTIFALNNCKAVFKEKSVAGVSVVSCAFFTLWGLWNVFYYPTLGQTYSFYCGIGVLLSNLLYVILLIKYKWYYKAECL